mgnify:CR=1 FL=1
MKKNWIYLFLSMAIVAPLTSCSNDDDEPKPKEEQQHDPTSDADQVAIAAYDALEWLQGSLVWWTRTAKLSVESVAKTWTSLSPP